MSTQKPINENEDLGFANMFVNTFFDQAIYKLPLE